MELPADEVIAPMSIAQVIGYFTKRKLDSYSPESSDDRLASMAKFSFHLTARRTPKFECKPIAAST
jgi:hypothetical protein